MRLFCDILQTICIAKPEKREEEQKWDDFLTHLLLDMYFSDPSSSFPSSVFLQISKNSSQWIWYGKHATYIITDQRL